MERRLKDELYFSMKRLWTLEPTLNALNESVECLESQAWSGEETRLTASDIKYLIKDRMSLTSSLTLSPNPL